MTVELLLLLTLILAETDPKSASLLVLTLRQLQPKKVSPKGTFKVTSKVDLSVQRRSKTIIMLKFTSKARVRIPFGQFSQKFIQF